MAKSGPEPKVSDKEVMDVFRESDEPFLQASEVAEQVSISRRAVHNRLTNIVDEGSMLSKKEVGKFVVYYQTPIVEEDGLSGVFYHHTTGLREVVEKGDFSDEWYTRDVERILEKMTESDD